MDLNKNSKIVLGVLIIILTTIIGLNIGYFSALNVRDKDIDKGLVKTNEGIVINEFSINDIKAEVNDNSTSVNLEAVIRMESKMDKNSNYFARYEYWIKGNSRELFATDVMDIGTFPFNCNQVIDNLNYDEDYEYRLILNGNSFSDTYSFSTNSYESKIQLEMYNYNRKPTESIRPRFRITNVSGEDIDISELKLRYYYTIDMLEIDEDQIMYFDKASYRSGLGGTDIKNKMSAEFIKLDKPRDKADYYVEISFDNSIENMEIDSSIELWTRFSKEKYSEFFDHSGDYSFNPETSEFSVWNKVTMYLGNKKIFGKEPITDIPISLD